MKIEDTCFKDDAAISQMIEELGGIDNEDESHVTPLCFAALNGIHADIIVKLINKYHANPNKACSNDDTTPLQNAILSGVKESIYALLGMNVYVTDEEGNPVEDKTRPSSEQPKKDAAGNPLPERDENDDIIYTYYNGVPVPLNDGIRFISDDHQQRCKLNGKLVFVPPISYNLSEDQQFLNIKYIYDKEGNHSFMKGEDGAPLKQYHANGREIHKLDDNGKELKNNFEYVWDYEALPKYQVAYDYKEVCSTSFATIDAAAILTASGFASGADTPAEDTPLGIIIHKYCNCSDSTHNKVNFSTITDSNNNTPIFLAVNVESLQSIELLIAHDSNVTASVNHFNDTYTSATALAISNGNEDVLSMLRPYMQSVSSQSVLEGIERFITDEDNIPADSRPDCIGVVMPVLMNMVYGNSIYSVATSHEYHTTKLGDDNTTIHLPDVKSLLDYAELALKYLPTSQVSTLKNTILDDFISGGTAKDLTTEFPIIKKKCYTILNLLKSEHLLDTDDENAQDNRDAILNAVESKKLDENELTDWPWWEYVTITYTNTLHPDWSEVPLPERKLKGSEITLPEIEDITYEDSSHIKWHPSKWNINDSSYDFNSSYTINDDVTANLEYAKAEITLSFSNTLHSDLPIILHGNMYGQSGDSFTLPTSDETYTDSSGLKWQIRGWDIDGTRHGPGDSVVLYESSTADVVCEKISVTLTFAHTYPATIPLDSPITEISGTSITLPTVSGDYIYEDHTYTPLNWSIDGTTYSFGASYTLKDNVTANLICSESIITIGIICDGVNTSLNENETYTYHYRLSSAPTGNVSLNVVATTNSSRVNIQTSMPLTFTPSNWDTDQSVTIKAVNNDVDDDDASSIITATSSSSDTRYNNLTSSFTITVIDNDTAGIVYDSTTGSVTEGGSDLIRKVKLKSKPTGDVTLSFTSNKGTRLNIVTSSVTFTPSEWSTFKNITFRAFNNDIVDGSVEATVTATVTSADPKYDYYYK